jgi:hypothetical protein
MVDRGLLFEFFLSFARFEYALKNTDFNVHHRSNHVLPIQAQPDWERFAFSLRATFNGRRTADLSQAFDYLTFSPPNKQSS